jgi:hypothetical protein
MIVCDAITVSLNCEENRAPGSDQSRGRVLRMQARGNVNNPSVHIQRKISFLSVRRLAHAADMRGFHAERPARVRSARKKARNEIPGASSSKQAPVSMCWCSWLCIVVSLIPMLTLRGRSQTPVVEPSPSACSHKVTVVVSCALRSVCESIVLGGDMGRCKENMCSARVVMSLSKDFWHSRVRLADHQ